MAPESRSDTVLALFEFKWIKTRTVIDFRAGMYTLELLGLISANLIRLRENPIGLLLPSLVQASLCSRWIKSSVGLGGSLLDLPQ